MRYSFIYFVNIILSISYTILSASIFVIIQMLAVISPFLIGFALWYLLFKNFLGFDQTSAVNFWLLGGIVGSALSFYGVIRILIIGFGKQKTGHECYIPAVLSLVEETTNKLRVSGFEKIYLSTYSDIATYYSTGGKFLILSIIAVKYLSKNELEAVIAHECAHHHHGSMLLNRIHYRMVRLFEGFVSSILESYSTIDKMSNSTMFEYVGNAARFTFLIEIFYINVFRTYLLIMGFLLNDAEYEYYCDSIAVKECGGRIFASAL